VIAAALFAAACAPALNTRAAAFSSGRITITTVGSGPDVVLIPGLASSAEQVWSGTVAAVPGYRYHLVQVSGFAGFPAGDNAREGRVVEAIAEEIARYIREQRLKRPAVVGMSMGGTLAMLVATRHPGAVSKLMVVDMVPFGGALLGETDPEGARPRAERSRERMLSESDEARRRGLTAQVAEMVRTDSLRARVTELGLASDRGVSARSFHDVMTIDLRREMARVDVPVTVLYVHAPLIPLSAEATDSLYREAYAHAPRVTLKRIDDAYHFIMLDQPRVFAAEVRAFLR
jgi:pimeloyl-ACP methyl ester carboxylesterase